VKNWLVIRISQVPDVFRQKFGEYGVKYIIAKNSDGSNRIKVFVSVALAPRTTRS
jgi:hypothetical protein